jgi:hypothetical protein
MNAQAPSHSAPSRTHSHTHDRNPSDAHRAAAHPGAKHRQLAAAVRGRACRPDGHAGEVGAVRAEPRELGRGHRATEVARRLPGMLCTNAGGQFFFFPK